MVDPAPKVDSRSAVDIARQVQNLLEVYTPDWQEFDLDPVTGNRIPRGISAVLIGTFARFSEIIIQRLNQVPNKNFLAFLDLLGASRLPPQPARVPLMFLLSTGSTMAIVPAGTQVAALPVSGEEEPVIFETERELMVTAAELKSVIVTDPAQDQYGDYSELTSTLPAPPTDVPAFQGNQPLEHILYIGHDTLLGYSDLQALRLDITLDQPIQNPAPRNLQWEIWDGVNGIPIVPTRETTASLTQSGVVGFEKLGQLTTDGQPAIVPQMVDGITNRWVRCRLQTPVTPGSQVKKDMVPASQLPAIKTIKLRVGAGNINLKVGGFTNQVPIDPSKDFFPLGEKPRFGDTLYLANSGAFSKVNTRVTLRVELTNPTSADNPPLKKVKTDGNASLRWEFWNGSDWKELGTTKAPDGVPNPNPADPNQFKDTTKAFTDNPDGKPGEVSFKLPEAPAKTIVNGVEDYWIRVRLVAGNYGQEAQYTATTRPTTTRVTDGRTTTETTTQTTDFVFIPETFAPPSIHAISVSYGLITDDAQTEPPEAVLIYNNLVYEDVTAIAANPEQSFQPFQTAVGEHPSLYLGFTLPVNLSTLPNGTLSLYLQTADRKYGEAPVPLSPRHSQAIAAAGKTASHTFLITNPGADVVRLTPQIVGTQWATVLLPGQITLAAHTSQTVEVQVTIPPTAPPQSFDRGFLQLTQTNPAFVSSAIFDTFAESLPDLNERPKLSWQYWNGKAWTGLTVQDETAAFSRTGLVEILPPVDFTPRSQFGLTRYWLKLQREKAEYPEDQRLRHIWRNTTTAAQTTTIRDEILGSSDGSEHQVFHTTRAPVLGNAQLEVREAEIPAADDQVVIKQEEGDDAIAITVDAAGRPQEIWVRWHAVPDFYGSGPRDRHYVLDPLTGEIQFGNGVNGLIPPLGAGNLRLAYYQTGGGVAGNRPAGAIVQLKTTIPYVEQVLNPDAATGGADAETLDSLMERAPRTIRHGGRAVTLEDYEDLAMLASPAVARARCVPLRDLMADPEDQQPTIAGDVSVIIVPYSQDIKPLPNMELINRVQTYLSDRSIPTASVAVVGPLYIRVSVTVEIALASLEHASTLERTINQTLTSFLHPLTGGFDGTGWAFGREPYPSDFYRLTENIPGVDHIRSLHIDDGSGDSTIDAIKQTGRFLVYSGTHRISLTFDPED